MPQPLLFDVPATGARKTKEKLSADPKISQRRYYLHKQLNRDWFTLTANDKEVETCFAKFEDIPTGQRFYISQLKKLGYVIKYDIQEKLQLDVRVLARKKK